MLWLSEFKLYMLLLFTTDNKSQRMYCGGNCNIFKFLNKSLQEFLFLLTVIVLIALFCSLKILVLSVEFPQNIITYDIAE
jgi:hypothetical protein